MERVYRSSIMFFLERRWWGDIQEHLPRSASGSKKTSPLREEWKARLVQLIAPRKPCGDHATVCD